MSSIVRALSIAVVCTLIIGCSSSYRSPVSPQRGPETPANLTAEAIERGRLLTSTACAGCHATGATGESPLADAPPFREMVHRYSLDQMEQAFAEGMVTTHPAMPDYRFRASEIDDIIAYLEDLKTNE
jgi:mono/diheme cytochrome c family protein